MGKKTLMKIYRSCLEGPTYIRIVHNNRARSIKKHIAVRSTERNVLVKKTTRFAYTQRMSNLMEIGTWAMQQRPSCDFRKRKAGGVVRGEEGEVEGRCAEIIYPTYEFDGCELLRNYVSVGWPVVEETEK